MDCWLWRDSVLGANLEDPEAEAAGDKKREGLPLLGCVAP